MLLKEQDLGFYNKSSNLIDLLESMDSVRIDTHCAATIPIVEQTIEGNKHYLIQLESLIEYAENNDVEDFNTALHNVCEASSVDANDITLTIQEYNAIADEELLNFSKFLLNEGYNISLVSISDSDPVSIIGNYCLEQCENDGDYEYWLNLFAESSYAKEHREAFGIDFKGEKVASFSDLRLAPGSAKDKIDFLLSMPTAKNDEEKKRGRNEEGRPVISQYAKDTIKTFRKTYSDEELLKKVTNIAGAADPFVNSYRRFDQGNMNDVQDKIEKHNVIYNNVRSFTEKPADFFNDKDIHKDESKFNAAKKSTLDHLKYAEENIQKFNLDVRGLNDKNVEDAKSRIQKLSKMVEQEQFPKTWLAKKIAWLRSLYRNIMYKLTLHKSDGPWKSVTNPLRSIAGFILRLIDKLALKLQNAVN